MSKDFNSEIWKLLIEKASDFVIQNADPSRWTKDFLKLDLYSNQVEIVSSVCDLKKPYVVIIGSRGGGKSYGTCIGLVKLCTDHPGIEVGIFGPRTDQAVRLVTEIKKILHNSVLVDSVDWDRTTADKVFFKNGSYMLALSAAETSLQEGWHFDIIVIDEAHRITNASVSQRIMPMLGSKKISKLIKIGIPLFKNHFFQSYKDSKYTVIEHDWIHSPILLESGFTEISGKRYPSFIIDRMPKGLKVSMFPDNTELHFDGDMTELEFNTQYGMKWMDDINTFLSAEDLERLVGASDIQRVKRDGEDYYFGLDTSSGTLMPGKYDLDFTALCIWKKRGDGVKEKIFCREWQGTESLSQLEDIIPIIHPVTGVFPCSFGCIDYSNIGITAVELFKRYQIHVAGVLFSATEPTSKKNYKNAMATHFKFELQADRIKYPMMEEVEKDKTFRKHYHQWMMLEKHQSVGLNDKILAPSGMHDDGCMADLLATYAADKHQSFAKRALSGIKLPGPHTARSIMSPGNQSGRAQGRRFL